MGAAASRGRAPQPAPPPWPRSWASPCGAPRTRPTCAQASHARRPRVPGARHGATGRRPYAPAASRGCSPPPVAGNEANGRQTAKLLPPPRRAV
eukprot:7377648-Prymnesium_polylepis.2